MMDNKIGFMQGRLSNITNGIIQSFPWMQWKEEIDIAGKHGYKLIEWTLDYERLAENPIMRPQDQKLIHKLCKLNNVGIKSLTGDCFMQMPFWKKPKPVRQKLIKVFMDVVDACSTLDLNIIVVPLVDGGSLKSRDQEDMLWSVMLEKQEYFRSKNIRIAFESDYEPQKLREFIIKFPKNVFGVNYDIGNSASMGFSPSEEFAAYGDRIINVHVKDRLLGGGTVPLGSGCADFRSVFNGLRMLQYKGAYILQTARASDGDHLAALNRYRDLTHTWLRS